MVERPYDKLHQFTNAVQNASLGLSTHTFDQAFSYNHHSARSRISLTHSRSLCKFRTEVIDSMSDCILDVLKCSPGLHRCCRMRPISTNNPITPMMLLPTITHACQVQHTLSLWTMHVGPVDKPILCLEPGVAAANWPRAGGRALRNKEIGPCRTR